MIVLNERHLHRILADYFDYYHNSRPHLSLDRNSPTPREVEPPFAGRGRLDSSGWRPASSVHACRVTDEPQWTRLLSGSSKVPAPTAILAACFPCCFGRLEHTVLSEYPSIKPPSFPPDEFFGKDRPASSVPACRVTDEPNDSSLIRFDGQSLRQHDRSRSCSLLPLSRRPSGAHRILRVPVDQAAFVPLGRVFWEGQWLEAIVEDTRTPVPDQVAFRIDFPAWLNSQTKRNRRIAEVLAVGCTTGEVAKRFRLSSGRISQLRQEFHRSWQEFHGDTAVLPPDFAQLRHTHPRMPSFQREANPYNPS